MLPPEVQARVEEMVAAAPPLSPAQQRTIIRVFAHKAAEKTAPP